MTLEQQTDDIYNHGPELCPVIHPFEPCKDPARQKNPPMTQDLSKWRKEFYRLTATMDGQYRPELLKGIETLLSRVIGEMEISGTDWQAQASTNRAKSLRKTLGIQEP